MGAGVPARIRFFDPTGQRALAADGEPPRAGEVGAAQETGGQNQFVMRTERVTLGRDLCQQDFGDEGTPPEAFVFGRDRLPPNP
jgi:hypothetical protein